MTSYDNWKLATPDYVEEKVKYPSKEESELEDLKNEIDNAFEEMQYYYEIGNEPKANEWADLYLSVSDKFHKKSLEFEEKLNEYNNQ